MKANFFQYILNFKRPGGTSRGVLHHKETWFLIIRDGERFGIGECGLFRGLSPDDREDYPKQLAETCKRIEQGLEPLMEFNKEFPSIRIGLETAFLSLEHKDPFQIFPSDFSTNGSPIDINGLIWMGDPDFMRQQIRAKIDDGFSCIKLKIGALDFDTEIDILSEIRQEFSSDQIVLRVDANGALTPEEALGKLERLAKLDLHSIEQPIMAGQWAAMAELCRQSPLPIALDEELIGMQPQEEGRKMMDIIRPDFLILKPSLIGGFASSDHWIELAGEYGADWWVTSALESNVGLNAIAQYTYLKSSKLPQGLGTGGLYYNNVPSPLRAGGGVLRWDPQQRWDLTAILPPE